MFVVYDERPSDSLFVDKVWRSRSGDSGELLSVAASRVELVIARVRSRTLVTVRGPETRPGLLHYPGDAEWVGIRFKLGTFLPSLLPFHLRDRQDVELPGATAQSFWLNGSVFGVPHFRPGREPGGAAHQTRGPRPRSERRWRIAGTARGKVGAIRAAPLPPGNGTHRQGASAHQPRTTGHGTPEERRVNPRCGSVGWVLRPGTSHAVAHAPDRANACADSAGAHHAFAQPAASSAPDPASRSADRLSRLGSGVRWGQTQV